MFTFHVMAFLHFFCASIPGSDIDFVNFLGLCQRQANGVLAATSADNKNIDAAWSLQKNENIGFWNRQTSAWKAYF